jgi:Holliday junction resolvase-like predicted endonuclease
VGAAGERFAAWWLIDRGMKLVASNVAADGGEVDLLMTDAGVRVAVEVRSVTGDGDPIDAIGLSKRGHVRRLGARVGAKRVDCVGVGFRTWGVEVHWVPG